MGAAYAKAVEGVGIGPESLARGLATHTGEPVLTTDVETDPRWEPWRGMAARFDYRGCWSFPIHTGAGRYVGTLAIYAREPREATERDLELAALLTQTAAIIVAQHAEAAARKRAADALRASEARFRAFVTTGSDVVYRMSPDWSEMRALDGQGFLSDAPEPTDAWMNRYIHPDDQAEVAAAVARAVPDKTMFRLEHRVRRSDGSLAWTLSRAIPLFDERGEITEWIGAATNLTSNKQTAEAAKTSQRRPGRVK
jgi:PAS domain-containing protein